MQQQNKAEGQAHLGPGQPYSKAHSPEAYVKVKTRPVGAGGGEKATLVGQILPIYGFGILLYILYILFKVSLYQAAHTEVKNKGHQSFWKI